MSPLQLLHCQLSRDYFLLAPRTLLMRSTRFADCENTSLCCAFSAILSQHCSHFLCQLLRRPAVFLPSAFNPSPILLYPWVFPVAPLGLKFMYIFFFLFVPVPESELPALIRIPLLNFRLFLSELSSCNCYRTRNGYWKNSI